MLQKRNESVNLGKTQWEKIIKIVYEYMMRTNEKCIRCHMLPSTSKGAIFTSFIDSTKIWHLLTKYSLETSFTQTTNRFFSILNITRKRKFNETHKKNSNKKVIGYKII